MTFFGIGGNFVARIYLNRSLLDKPVGFAGADFQTRDVT